MGTFEVGTPNTLKPENLYKLSIILEENYQDNYGTKTKKGKKQLTTSILSSFTTYSILSKMATKLMLRQVTYPPNSCLSLKFQAHTLHIPTLTNELSVWISIQDF